MQKLSNITYLRDCYRRIRKVTVTRLLDRLKPYWLISFFIVLLLSYTISCQRSVVKETGLLTNRVPLQIDRAKKVKSVLVKFRPKVKSAARRQILEEQTDKPVERVRKLAVYEIDIKPGKSVQQTVKALESENEVEYAEANHRRSALVLATPNDPLFGLQYGLSKIMAPAAWDVEKGQTNTIKAAVVDTGVDLIHPDLSSKIVNGWDFVNNDNVAQDDHGHGTHVAGIISATTDNSVGVAGTSWGAQIMPVKVLDSDGSGTDADVSNGITWAVDNGAKVINLSLGGYEFSQTMQNATDYAYNRGVMVFAAAGNDGDSTVIYPAGNSNVVGVAATNSADRRASFSNFNSFVDVSAPGVNIASTYLGSQYAYLSGTSMATPYASGLAALLFSQNTSISTSQLFNTITLSSTDLGSSGWDAFFGYGRINAYNAVSSKPVVTSFSVRTGSYVKGHKKLAASVRDVEGISSVLFMVDGQLKASDSSAPYETIINTARLANGKHQFGLKAVDVAGNETSVNRVATVDNYRPKTFAPRKSRVRRNRRGIARAKLFWKVYDPYSGRRAYVKLKIFKKVRGRYRLVKVVNYGWTIVNKTRVYRWRLRSKGLYKFFVFAKDRAGNRQRFRARNYVIVR